MLPRDPVPGGYYKNYERAPGLMPGSNDKQGFQIGRFGCVLTSDVRQLEPLTPGSFHIFSTGFLPDKLYDINTGPFRMPAACLDRIRKMRPQSLVAHFPYHCENGTCRYPGQVEEKLMKLISSEISKRVEPDRIHVFDRFVNSNDFTGDAY